MLGKLMKYEIKATSRWFLPLYAALIVLALLNRLLYSWNALDFPSAAYGTIGLADFAMIPKMLVTMVYIFIIVATFVITAIVMIQRFYKNLLGDEGYLMFTLPVSPWKNVVSKLVVSVMWFILSGFFAFCSIMILVLSPDIMVEIPDVFMEIMRGINTYLGINAGLFFIEIGALCFIGLLYSILQVYLSISLGQLSNSHKLLTSVGAYIGINIVTQTISGVASIPFYALFYPYSNTLQEATGMLHRSLLFGGIISLLFTIAFYVGTHIILTRKLNLE